MVGSPLQPSLEKLALDVVLRRPFKLEELDDEHRAFVAGLKADLEFMERHNADVRAGVLEGPLLFLDIPSGSD